MKKGNRHSLCMWDLPSNLPLPSALMKDFNICSSSSASDSWLSGAIYEKFTSVFVVPLPAPSERDD